MYSLFKSFKIYSYWKLVPSLCPRRGDALEPQQMNGCIAAASKSSHWQLGLKTLKSIKPTEITLFEPCELCGPLSMLFANLQRSL